MASFWRTYILLVFATTIGNLKLCFFLSFLGVGRWTVLFKRGARTTDLNNPKFKVNYETIVWVIIKTEVNHINIRSTSTSVQVEPCGPKSRLGFSSVSSRRTSLEPSGVPEVSTAYCNCDFLYHSTSKNTWCMLFNVTNIAQHGDLYWHSTQRKPLQIVLRANSN